MKICEHLFFTVTLILISNSLFSQPGRPSISPEPTWISKKNIDYNKNFLDKDAIDGYIDISYETQVSLADESKYCRYSKKIISETGVQNGSQISVSFDPSYQHLIFHTIHVIRNGEIFNRLKLSNIKTVHQEKELNNFIYNGSLNAILIPEDVRKGDIIEYSYTIQGFNPIFKGKYSDEYTMTFSAPVYEMYYKIIVPEGRKINTKNLNEPLQPTITSANGLQIYEWHKTNITPVHLQDYTPSWYDPYDEILVSEYNDWKEVNDWALQLFPINKTLSASLENKIKEIEKKYINDTERTKAALQFVQDDIRYMGIEMGENSHKPADPSKVYSQRFGDCKEKSYLLCCMLNAMNIEADPVLINTVSKGNINSLLPSPTDFDHVTVRVKLNNNYYWYDPTIAYQRGSITNLYYPDFQTGLVISNGTSSLSSIVFRNVSYEHTIENFKVSDMFGEGSLIVTTTFSGNLADETRGDFKDLSITEIMDTYQKFYATYYDDIKADSLTFIDNDSIGTFTTTEYYTIPNFWTVEKDGTQKFSFSPFIINSILKRPKEKNRKMPFVLPFPANYQERINIELPENWKVSEDEFQLKNAGFTYNCKFYCVYNHVYLLTDYENNKDNVTANEAPTYFKDLAKYDEDASFELTSGKSSSEKNTSSTSNKNVLSTILFIGVIVGGMVWWNRRK